MPLVALSQQTGAASRSHSETGTNTHRIRENRPACLAARLKSVSAVQAKPQAKPDARERILDTAYQLYSGRAIRDVGVNEVIRGRGGEGNLYRTSRPERPGSRFSSARGSWSWRGSQRQAEAAPHQRKSYSDLERFANGSSATTSKPAHSSTCYSRWAPHTPPPKPASGISRASERSWLVSQRRPHCVTQRPSRTRGTSS